MRMQFRGFSVIPMTAIALAMMLPAKAVWAQSGPGDRATARPQEMIWRASWPARGPAFVVINSRS